MRKIFTFILFYCLFLSIAVADTTPKGISNDSLFKLIPILDDGRVKPLETYSRHVLLQLSGRESYAGKSASQWLMHLLFAPDTVKDEKIFLINNPEIATALKIEPEKKRRYSINQIQPNYPKLVELALAAKQIPAKEHSVTEAEIVRVYDNLQLYAQLSHTLQFAFNHADFSVQDNDTVHALGLKSNPNNAYSFLDIALSSDQMKQTTEGVEQKSLLDYTHIERNTLQLLSNLFQWSSTYRNLPFYVIPPPISAQGMWLSPWDAIAMDFKSVDTRQLLIFWRDMTKAYNNGEQIAFDLAAKNYLEAIKKRADKAALKNIKKFPLEVNYHQYQPFLIAKIFYILILVTFVIFLMTSHKSFYPLAWIFTILAFIPHLWALIARIIIMARPPVTNLYETFIFVGLMAVLLGIIIEWVSKRWIGLVIIGISGVSMLMIAARYAAEGDTMQMLIAVLNSNFWLGTHVITITIGYSACCVAGILGHIWLIQRATNKAQDDLSHTYRIMMGMLGLSLVLTFFGTNLGGIWADQSWGRFWGWDPKENGALMIVLWCALLLHAKIANIVGPLGLAIGNVLGMIVVMWAWFGVNLLSIGLHSYGFTSGIALSLGIYFIAEIIFILWMLLIIKKK